MRRCRSYLSKVDPAVSGRGGHDAAYRAARIIVNDFAVPLSEAWRLLIAYNKRCEPSWSQEELGHKLARVDPAHVAPRGPMDRFSHVGVRAQVQPGLNWIGVHCVGSLGIWCVPLNRIAKPIRLRCSCNPSWPMGTH